MIFVLLQSVRNVEALGEPAYESVGEKQIIRLNRDPFVTKILEEFRSGKSLRIEAALQHYVPACKASTDSIDQRFDSKKSRIPGTENVRSQQRKNIFARGLIIM